MKHFAVLIVDSERCYTDMLPRRLALRRFTCKPCYDGQPSIKIVE